ncbi:hypothetical protein [Glycomyces sp. YM15]|uniref:hypothetical protein n=1 Tax=Glycomyces sp. YM15 TaxID=2800446 RepID=UPI0019650E7C|nr:hypothetical protein [Glycomyces sp. YM15]
MYWYSIGFGEYRFPSLAASALFTIGIAGIAWWWVRATAMLSEERRELVSTRAQMRYRRLALLISYALVSASAALAAGIQGSDASWHRFTDGDPEIRRAVVTDLVEGRVDKWGRTCYLDGYATLDGVHYPFHSEPVHFGAGDSVDPATVEVWAMLDPDDTDTGIVVMQSRSELASLLERPILPLLPVGLVVAACCWAVQRLRVRREQFPERHLDPIVRIPGLLWMLFAIPCALWIFGIVCVAVIAGSDRSYQPSHVVGLVLWLVFLLPGVACAGRFFSAAASAAVTRFGGLSEVRNSHHR